MGPHHAYLNIGSNIGAEANLPAAVELLRRYCEVVAVSGVVETEAVGSAGGTFLNVGVEVRTELDAARFKQEVARVVEERLGRVRGPGSGAGHTVDVDIVLFDGELHEPGAWEQAHVVVPTAELLPDLVDPLSGRALSDLAAAARAAVRLVDRPDVVVA